MKKNFMKVGLVLILVSMVGFLCRAYELKYPNREHVMTDLTKNMQTHCVGRLLIDLPQGSHWKNDASSARIDDLSIEIETHVTYEEYVARMEKRRGEIASLKPQSDRYLNRPAETLRPGGGDYVFAYAFRQSDGPGIDGKWEKSIAYEAEGYAWRNGTFFKVGPDLYSQPRILKILPRLQARLDHEIPNRPGFCLNGAFIEGYYDLEKDEEEEISWGFKLPKNLGLVVRHTKVWSPQETLFERQRESEGEVLAYLAALIKPGDTYEQHVFRKAARSVRGLNGEEIVAGSVEDSGKQGYLSTVGGTWEYPGAGNESPAPAIEVSIDTPEVKTSYIPSPAGGFPKPADMPEGLTEAEFFEVYDAIINSIRPRPGAFAPPPSSGGPVSGSPLGRDLSFERILAGLGGKR